VLLLLLPACRLDLEDEAYKEEKGLQVGYLEGCKGFSGIERRG
jgi:hypothetical protein